MTSLFCGFALFFLFCWVCWRVACFEPDNGFRQFLRGVRHGICTAVMLREIADGAPGQQPHGYDNGFAIGMVGTIVAAIILVILLMIGVFA